MRAGAGGASGEFNGGVCFALLVGAMDLLVGRMFLFKLIKRSFQFKASP